MTDFTADTRFMGGDAPASRSHPIRLFPRSVPRLERATRGRVMLALAAFLAVYGAIGGRLVHLATRQPAAEIDSITAAEALAAARPNIVDRNGELLATDIRAPSLYADPRSVLDVDETVEKLRTVLPGLDPGDLRKTLSSDRAFVFVRREITPQQERAIHDLGLPGIGFVYENRRFYPGGPLAGHVLGAVNVDNQGIAGIEQYVDRVGLGDLQQLGFAVADRTTLEPVRVSLDLRVQHVVRDELVKAMQRYKAKSATGIVLDVTTGEVLAMSSVPDFDPNTPAQMLVKGHENRALAGLYEMGSTFKMFSVAMALDTGRVTLNDTFDARQPVRIGRYAIHDFHGKHRMLTVPEVFIYSSNIGTVRMIMTIGQELQQDYLRRLGLMDRLVTELPETATPILPPRWSDITMATVAFGHGISVTPMQTAAAAAALVNGGLYITPTFVPRTPAEAAATARRVISPQTSAKMRYLMRLNVEKGSGRRADVEGYFVGGKTGTAEKVINGRYSNDTRFNAFVGAFPMDAPRYLVLVTLDEPQPAEGQYSAVAGLNTAPLTGSIIARAAPMLDVMPRHDGQGSSAMLASF